MNVKEKFEQIIREIESSYSKEHEVKSSDVAESIAKKMYMGNREINVLFSFFTGTTLIKYIGERRLMAAYKLLLEQDELNIEQAVCVSGLDNQSSFSKSFKNLFKISPSEAYNKKDETLYIQPLTWDALSKEDCVRGLAKTTEDREYIFGVSKKQYDEIVEYQEYQALYDFDDVQSEVVYNYIEASNLPQKVAFEITHKISEEHYDYGTQDTPMSVSDLEFFMPDKSEVVFLYENVTQDVEVILDLIGNSDGQLFDVDVKYILWYLESYSDKWYFNEYLGLVKDFVKFNGDDLDEYFEYIEHGYTPEGAVIFSKGPADDFDEVSDKLEVTRLWLEEKKDCAFERWAQEETDFSQT